MSCVEVDFSGWRNLIPLQGICVNLATVTLLEQSTAARSAPRYTQHKQQTGGDEWVLHFNYVISTFSGWLKIFLFLPVPLLFFISAVQAGGQCQCKVAVTGRRCTDCLSGWYGLTASNPNGCTRCNCSDHGIINNATEGDHSCNPYTGLCQCKLHVTGKQTIQIKHEF